MRFEFRALYFQFIAQILHRIEQRDSRKGKLTAVCWTLFVFLFPEASGALVNTIVIMIGSRGGCVGSSRNRPSESGAFSLPSLYLLYALSLPFHCHDHE